jgi:ArsR family transcriptional regulator
MTTATSPILDRMDALADASRSRLLCLLETQELTVSELQAVLQQPQSTVSRHLKILGTAGWVVSRVEGTSRWYSLDDRLPASAMRLWQTVRDEVVALPAVRHDRERLRAVLAARRTTSKAFFSSAAGEWDAVRRELFGAGTELSGLLGLLDQRWVVADLGCGTGQVAASVAPFVAQVVAVDDSPEMLSTAAGRLADLDNVDVRQGELESLPVADDELDVAILSLVLHHIVDPLSVLSEVRRALRPGGKVLIIDMMPHDRDEYRRDMGHVWSGFAEADLSGWLKSSGLIPTRYRSLPADPAALGPTLFVASAAAPENAP